MIKFKVLISLVKAGCKRPLIMDPHFFSSFLNTNLIAWLNVFTSQKFFNVIVVFKYYIATMILIFKSTPKYDTFMFLK